MGAAGSPEAFSRADLDFHRSLFRATRNPMPMQLGRLVDPLRQAFLETDRARWGGPDQASVTLHRTVADAVVAGDGAAARRAMEGLIEWTRDLLQGRTGRRDTPDREGGAAQAGARAAPPSRPKRKAGRPGAGGVMANRQPSSGWASRCSALIVKRAEVT